MIMTSLLDFGLDLWTEVIISNNLSNQEIFNLSMTCKFLSQLLKTEKVLKFIEDRKIHFGIYRVNQEKGATAVAWSHDNHALASGYNKGKIFVWNPKTGQVQKTLCEDAAFSVSCLTFHPQDANLLAVGQNDHDTGSLCLWDIATNKVRRKYVSQATGITCIAFHPQARYLLAGCQRTVLVWNVETGDCEKKNPNEQNDDIRSVSFSRDGRYFGTSAYDILCFWDFATFQIVQKIQRNKGYDEFSFQFFDDNKTLAWVTAKDPTVRFVDLQSGNENLEIRITTNNYNHKCIAIHPNQKIIGFGGDYGFEIWDLQSRKLIDVQGGYFVKQLTFSPNGKALAVAFYSHFEIIDIEKNILTMKNTKF